MVTIACMENFKEKTVIVFPKVAIFSLVLKLFVNI